MIDIHLDPPPKMVELIGVKCQADAENIDPFWEDTEQNVILKIKCEDGIFILLLDRWLTNEKPGAVAQR